MGNEENRVTWDGNVYDRVAVVFGFLTAGFAFTAFMLARSFMAAPQDGNAVVKTVVIIAFAVLSVVYFIGMVCYHVKADRQRIYEFARQVAPPKMALSVSNRQSATT